MEINMIKLVMSSSTTAKTQGSMWSCRGVYTLSHQGFLIHIIIQGTLTSWQGPPHRGGWHMEEIWTGTFCIMPSLWSSSLAGSRWWLAMSHGCAVWLSAAITNRRAAETRGQSSPRSPYRLCVCTLRNTALPSVLFLGFEPLQDPLSNTSVPSYRQSNNILIT